MPFLTPSIPYDPALIHAARMTPHTPSPAIDGLPLVLGGRQRTDSPFLDALPLAPIGRGESEAAVSDAMDPEDPDSEDRDTDGADSDDADHDDLDHDDFGNALLGGDAMALFVPPATTVAEPADDALPAGPFDRGAVERACARAARRVERVEATVTSDDGVADHVCDVTEWLAGATVRELVDLARAGWAGEEAAEIAAALADDDPEIADVLRHARRTDSEVVVEIDAQAAMAWLARHRPSVAEALDDGDEDDDPSDEG